MKSQRSSRSTSPISQQLPFSVRNPPKKHDCSKHVHPSTLNSFKDQIVKLKADKTNLTLQNSKLRRELNIAKSKSDLEESFNNSDSELMPSEDLSADTNEHSRQKRSANIVEYSDKNRSRNRSKNEDETDKMAQTRRRNASNDATPKKRRADDSPQRQPSTQRRQQPGKNVQQDSESEENEVHIRRGKPHPTFGRLETPESLSATDSSMDQAKNVHLNRAVKNQGNYRSHSGIRNKQQTSERDDYGHEDERSKSTIRQRRQNKYLDPITPKFSEKNQSTLSSTQNEITTKPNKLQKGTFDAISPTYKSSQNRTFDGTQPSATTSHPARYFKYQRKAKDNTTGYSNYGNTNGRFDHLPANENHAELQSFNKDFEAYKRHADEVAAQNPTKAQIESENVSLKRLVNKQKIEITDLKLKLNRTIEDSKQREQELLMNRKISIEPEAEQLRKRVNDLQRRIRSAETQRIEDQELLQNATLKVKNLENEVRLREKMAMTLEQEIKSYRENQSESVRQAQTKTAEAMSFKRSNELLKKEITELRTELILLKSDSTATSQAYAIQDNDIQNKATELMSFQNENEKLRNQITELETEVFRLKNSIPHIMVPN